MPIRTCFFWLLSAVLLLAGCSTDRDVAPLDAQLQGSWRWVQTTGGIAGVRLTPANTGYQEEIRFESNGSFYRLRDGKVIDSDTYSLFFTSAPADNRTPNLIRYGKNSLGQSFEITENRLTLYDEAADGYISQYER
ncbi:hypothetical protein D3Y59_08745 [Hymenobacter oligotrophus]|uniref:Lipocalin-like domain-containing protein n=1 Tax=Hymenobacter oligotrophus TaxID=2319843 RepID=A0A3B7R798_9BACT|nr:hypothetical protein [Hymenobacter oligotrophus]AYA37131.1 hypothetical protein D3Y59_08745 [Hymenobacter oligotrophus]